MKIFLSLDLDLGIWTWPRQRGRGFFRQSDYEPEMNRAINPWGLFAAIGAWAGVDDITDIVNGDNSAKRCGVASPSRSCSCSVQPGWGYQGRNESLGR